MVDKGKSEEMTNGRWGGSEQRSGGRHVALGTLSLLLCAGACATDHDGDEDGGGDDVSCGSGTVLFENECRPSAEVCGPDAELVDGVCRITPRPAPCAPGAEEREGLCHPIDHHYQLRVVHPSIAADGFSKVPVFAIGTLADGSVSTEAVVLRVSRPEVGGFVSSELELGALGATTFFTPCNAITSPQCAGMARLTLALASAPDQVVASVDVELRAPDGVGSMEPCLLGGSVMFFDGNDYIYDGTMTVRDASWSGSGSADRIYINLHPSSPAEGLWWNLEFSSRQLQRPLTRGVYDNAQRAPFASPGHPGIDVSGDGRGCNTIAGRFQVHAFDLQDGQLQRAAISFEQHCEAGPSVLRGCVYYQR
jgi:hypothetical protein